MTTNGSGVLGMLGIDTVPQGTVEELRAVGLDPAQIASCAPRSPGVRGCQFEPQCIFAQARYGGFKGQGPRNIGYYKREIEGQQKQDFMPCHGFVRSLVLRMRAGDVARESGQPHEQIRIVAQEGETITINPIVQVDPNDKRPTAEFANKPQKIQVPRHPRPGDNPMVTYEQQMWAEEQVRRRYDPEFGQAPPRPLEADDQLDLGETTFPVEPSGLVTAEPVKKGK